MHYCDKVTHPADAAASHQSIANGLRCSPPLKGPYAYIF